MIRRIKKIYLLVIIYIFISCNSSNENKIKISNEALIEFNFIFKDYTLNNKKYNFKNGFYLKKPPLNYSLLSTEDTTNISFFKLLDGENYLIVCVDRKRCFASVTTELNDFNYPNHSVIFPYDFSFLNKESLPVKFNCINEDTKEFREVNYDKNMIGKWELDSIYILEKNYIEDYKLKNLAIKEDYTITINDSVKSTYTHNAYNFEILNSKYIFYKIFVNKNNMILINVYNESYVECFFKKEDEWNF